jgi:hypothetical protein
MIVLCGVDEFPSGPWTKELASSFADSIGAELRVVEGGPAAHHVSKLEDSPGGVLLFGHAPPKSVAKALRKSPAPVVVAPAGVSDWEWDEVALIARDPVASEEAAATAGALAGSLGAPMRMVVAEPAKGSTGWQTYDVLRRLTEAAAAAGGPELRVDEPELRERLQAPDAREAVAGRASLIVSAADPAPSWFDVLRPSFVAELVHESQELVLVVPPGTTPAARTAASEETAARA